MAKARKAKKMARKTTTPRKNRYTEVAERLIKRMREAERLTWRTPHHPADLPMGLDGHVYRGINYFLLAGNDYADPRYITRNRALSLLAAENRVLVERTARDGRKYPQEVALVPVIKDDVEQTDKVRLVNAEGKATGRKKEITFYRAKRPAELAHEVILQKRTNYKGKNSETGEEETKHGFFIRPYFVYNVTDLTEHVAIPERKKHEPLAHTPVAAADGLIKDYVSKHGGPPIRRGSTFSPMYVWSLTDDTDEVRLPLVKSFKTTPALYATTFHELAHSTGHRSRLNRLEKGGFGSKPYSREELVAEMSAVMMCNLAGIDLPEIEENATAYLQSWLRALDDDPNMLLWAATRAQKACDFMQGIVMQYESDEPTAEGTADTSNVVELDAKRGRRAA